MRSGLDRGKAFKRVHGNKSHLWHLTHLFRESSPALLGQIERCAELGDRRGLRETLHTLKGGVVLFGRCDAYQTIIDFEDCIKRSFETEALAIEQFKRQYQLLQQQIIAFEKALQACTDN